MKKYLLPCSFALLLTFNSSGQNFTGQWKGTFLDKSTSYVGWGGEQCDYVLELEAKGTEVTGYSYTYFTEGGKKYYTICSLKGLINKQQKYVEIKETVRTKTNVPNNIRNCFQIHKLTYFKQDTTETLEGNWVPVPDQAGDCGYGTTSLQRRLLKKNYSLYEPVATKINKTAPNKKIPLPLNKNKAGTAIVKKMNSTAPNKKILQPVNKNKTGNAIAKGVPKQKDAMLKPQSGIVDEPVEIPATKNAIKDKIIAPIPNFEKRNNTILKTIEVENATIKVDLYDNGEIDGDSISLFYNGKLLLSHKRLSDKPITLNISVDNDKVMNELVMYAENLGSIPPNTALMIVTDGTRRYEVHITSDLEKSGTIRFSHKQPPGAAVH